MVWQHILKDLQESAAKLMPDSLPVRVPKGPVEPLLAVMRRDKKNLGGAMRFVLPQMQGHGQHRSRPEPARDMALGCTPSATTDCRS